MSILVGEPIPAIEVSNLYQLSLPSELHERIATIATTQGFSLNQWVNDTLKNAVNHETITV